MKTVLVLLAVLAFAAPVLVWAALDSAMCGHAGRVRCGIGLTDFMDDEFFMIAALPWLLAAALGLLAWRVGRKRRDARDAVRPGPCSGVVSGRRALRRKGFFPCVAA